MGHLVFGFGLAGIRRNQRSPNVSGQLIKAALGEAHGNKAEAMILGVRRRLLYEKLTEFGLT
jgi:DNA-binding NtrC family response regulator